MDYDDYHGDLLTTIPRLVCIGGDLWVNPLHVAAVGPGDLPNGNGLVVNGVIVGSWVHIVGDVKNALPSTKSVAEVVALLTGDGRLVMKTVEKPDADVSYEAGSM